MIDMDVCDADDRDMEEEPERFKDRSLNIALRSHSSRNG